MTKEEAISRLEECVVMNGDIEASHSIADGILCEFLTSLGYADVVSVWERVEKWYA